MKKTNRSKHGKELNVLSSRECRRLAKRAASMALAAAMAASTLCAPALAVEEGGSEIVPTSTAEETQSEDSAFKVKVLMDDSGSGTESDTEGGTESDTESGAEGGTEGGTESDTEGETEDETESDTGGGTEGETESDTEGETEDETESDTEGGTEDDTSKKPTDHFEELHQGEDGTTTVDRPEQSGSVEVNIGEEPTEGSAPLVPAKPAEDEGSDPEGGTESGGAGEGTEEAGEGTEESGEGTEEAGEGTEESGEGAEEESGEGAEEAGEGTEEAGEGTEESGEGTGEDTGDAPADEPEQEEVNWDLFYDETTGNYRINFHLTEATQEELVTLDLSNALAALREYAKQTGNDKDVFQPGDTRVFEIYITSDSGHTYKYLDGSFILETPDLTPDKTTEEDDPSQKDNDTVVGFDGQELPEEYQGDKSFELGMYSEPIKELLMEIGVMDETAAEQFLITKISYEDSRKLLETLKGKEGLEIKDEDSLQTALEKYLVNYYSEKEQTEYTDFETMMTESESQEAPSPLSWIAMASLSS